jgi:hypothetical protein
MDAEVALGRVKVLNVETESSSVFMEGKLFGIKFGISTDMSGLSLGCLLGFSCVGSSVRFSSSSAAKNSANSDSSLEKTCLVVESQRDVACIVVF